MGGIGRPGYGSDRTQRRERFSRPRSVARGAARERQRKSSEGRRCVRGRIRGLGAAVAGRGAHPMAVSRTVSLLGAGGAARGVGLWLRPARPVRTWGHRRSSRSGRSSRTTGSPGEGWVPVAALGRRTAPRRPDRGCRGGAGHRRSGGRVDRVPGDRGSGRRAAVRGGGGARCVADRGAPGDRRRRRVAALAPGRRGPVAVVVRRRARAVACRTPPSSEALVTGCSSPSSPPCGRRSRSPERVLWGNAASSVASAAAGRGGPPRPPPAPCRDVAGTCSTTAPLAGPASALRDPEPPDSAGPSAAARAASTTGFRAAGSAATACSRVDGRPRRPRTAGDRSPPPWSGPAARRDRALGHARFA